MKTAIPSDSESVLFAKYHGRTDLINDDVFWEDVLKCLNDYNIALPMEYSPENVRVLHQLIDCKPGTCGECCRYGITPLSQYDVHRMVNSGLKKSELEQCVYTRKDGSMFMRGEPAGADCPMLEGNVCTIYDVRPDACWLFPVQKGTHNVNGVRFIQYRIRCKPSVDVVRQVFRGALAGGNHLLLPNLTLIKEVNNGTNSKPNL